LLKTYKNKDLIGIPWMLAFALRADGWYLRQDIIWHKPNPMPESVKDRCTKSHEYIFMLSKNARYYFDSDAIQEDADPKNEARYKCAFNTGKEQENFRPNGASNTMGMKEYTGMRNKRDVWTIPPSSFKGAHFATFPEDLVKPCIMASTKVGGVVLDPFFGSGTTGAVAVSLNRNYIGVELNPEYIEIANNRLGNTQLSFFGLI
jgi:site-specific DNA-methyltransferase (adenine-specific)